MLCTRQSVRMAVWPCPRARRPWALCRPATCPGGSSGRAGDLGLGCRTGVGAPPGYAAFPPTHGASWPARGGHTDPPPHRGQHHLVRVTCRECMPQQRRRSQVLGHGFMGHRSLGHRFRGHRFSFRCVHYIPQHFFITRLKLYNLSPDLNCTIYCRRRGMCGPSRRGPPRTQGAPDCQAWVASPPPGARRRPARGLGRLVCIRQGRTPRKRTGAAAPRSPAAARDQPGVWPRASLRTWTPRDPTPAQATVARTGLSAPALGARPALRTSQPVPHASSSEGHSEAPGKGRMCPRFRACPCVHAPPCAQVPRIVLPDAHAPSR